jgi:3,4-dihydroxy 2-butanone 4-phosphate synthase / GTP cyclohydrolase II
MNDRPQRRSPERVRAALAAIGAGEPVVVADDAHRENEGDLIFAAELATPELVAFTVRNTSGLLCVAVTGGPCDRLRLTPMTHTNERRDRPTYQVSVDLHSTGTGISATSRAATIAALGSSRSTPHQFSRPRHVLPLRARAGGVLDRPGHTEAAVDLARLAGRTPAGALCEIVSVDRPGEMACGDELRRFADQHSLVYVTVTDLVDHRLRHEPRFTRIADTAMPTRFGTFRALGYAESPYGCEHLALVAGTIGNDRGIAGTGTPVHVHTECLCGDVFSATTCACRTALETALTEFGRTQRGVVIYVRPKNRPRACGLSEPGPAPHPCPEIVAASILADLGVTTQTDTGHPMGVELAPAAS